MTVIEAYRESLFQTWLTAFVVVGSRRSSMWRSSGWPAQGAANLQMWSGQMCISPYLLLIMCGFECNLRLPGSRWMSLIERPAVGFSVTGRLRSDTDLGRSLYVSGCS
ncbi:putative exoglucanase type C [Fusarium oxysporum f. sp. albedinis]|nr:putative exoglucanase type C [Fusarium oxysporum f. sp. albedinis]